VHGPSTRIVGHSQVVQKLREDRHRQSRMYASNISARYRRGSWFARNTARRKSSCNPDGVALCMGSRWSFNASRFNLRYPLLRPIIRNPALCDLPTPFDPKAGSRSLPVDDAAETVRGSRSLIEQGFLFGTVSDNQTLRRSAGSCHFASDRNSAAFQMRVASPVCSAIIDTQLSSSSFLAISDPESFTSCVDPPLHAQFNSVGRLRICESLECSVDFEGVPPHDLSLSMVRKQEVLENKTGFYAL